MTRTAREVAMLSSIDTKLRLSSHVLGQELVGSGSYCQLKRDHETLLKMELKLQVANQVSSLLQISDGRFFWVRRDLPQHKSLSRVDQRRVREAVAKAQNLPVANLDPRWLALGGLGRLMEGLTTAFDFSAPRADQMGTTPVWVVSGQWKPDYLGLLWPEKSAALTAKEPVDLRELPAHMPHRVIVVLSRDPALPIFPYRVEYQRLTDRGEPQPMVALDFYEVRRNAVLDPKLFGYKPGDQEVADETEQYLKASGL